MAVCRGSGKLRFAEARKRVGTVICPECGRVFAIQHWDGQVKEPGIPVHRALHGSTARLRRSRAEMAAGLQPDRGPAVCACGGRYTAVTDLIFGNAIIACDRCGTVER